MKNECQAVELVLRDQITDAIEMDYIWALRNPITDTIQNYIPHTWTFLQETYGRTSPNHLMEKENEFKDRIYDKRKPIDSVSKKVDRFADLCGLIKEPILDRHKVILAYKIVSKDDDFIDSLKSWNKKTFRDKTYSNMNFLCGRSITT